LNGDMTIRHSSAQIAADSPSSNALFSLYLLQALYINSTLPL
jgi:hypothetical protein